MMPVMKNGFVISIQFSGKDTKFFNYTNSIIEILYLNSAMISKNESFSRFVSFFFLFLQINQFCFLVITLKDKEMI